MILARNNNTPIPYWLELPLWKLRQWIRTNNIVVAEEKEEAAKHAAWENDQLPPDQEAPPESGPPEPQAAGEDTKKEGPEAPKTAALEEK